MHALMDPAGDMPMPMQPMSLDAGAAVLLAVSEFQH